MPNIFGEIKNVSLENLATDPLANTQGRIWHNTTLLRPKFDTGTNKYEILLRDGNFYVGTSGTMANNVRINRAGSAILQLLVGNNATAEGSMSATGLAILSSRLENYADALKPVFGNPGRLIYVTDLNEIQFDTGVSWLSVSGSGSGGWGALGVASISANTILTSGDNKRILQCDSSGAPFTLELPTPAVNFLLSIKDMLGTFGTNPVTLTRSAPTVRIEGLQADYELAAPFGAWSLYCDGSDYYFE